MPYWTGLMGQYSAFGNGYVPYFAVIGANYEFIHGGNDRVSAQNAAEAAMSGMININVVQPIPNVIIDANSSDLVDISNTFTH